MTRGGRLAASVVGLLCVAALAPAPANAQPVPPSAQAEQLPVAVNVESMSSFIRPGDAEVLHVAGRLTNIGDETLRRVRVRVLLDVNEPVTSRSGLDAPADSSGVVVSERDQVIVGDLQPRGADSASFGFDIPVADLPLDRTEARVYPLRVEVRSRVRSRSVRVGMADTFVPWWPVQTARTRVSWLWPLVDQSDRALGDDFYSEHLLEQLGDERLGTLLRVGADAAPKMPLTWAVDGEVLRSLDVLSRGYSVRGDQRPGRPEAAQWIATAKAAVRESGTVLALPYADADVVALAGTKLAAELGTAVRLGQQQVRTLLDASPDTRLAWPVGGELDVHAQTVLAGAGATGIVVAERRLPLSDELNYTPTAVTPLTSGTVGGLTALVADDRIADLVAQGPGAEGRRLAVQRYLAETAMITLERPSLARTVVVMPPHLWDPDPGYAEQLLAETGTVPWLAPISLADALADPPGEGARTLRSDPPPTGLSPTYVRDIATARSSQERYRSILTDQTGLPQLLDDALLRSASALWRDAPGAGRRVLNTVNEVVARELGKLAVATGGIVTLAGRTGRVPVTIVNDLGQPVRVRVRLRTRGRLLLASECYDECRPVTIAPGVVTLPVRGEAVTAGVFPIFVELLPPPPDDTLLAPPATLRVRSKNFGPAALAITVGAFALLLVGSAVRLLRRRRAAGNGGAKPGRDAEPAPDRAPDPAAP